MCNECGRECCAPSCPLFIGRKAVGIDNISICALCGSSFYETDTYFRKSELFICPACSTYAATDKPLISSRFLV